MARSRHRKNRPPPRTATPPDKASAPVLLPPARAQQTALIAFGLMVLTFFAFQRALWAGFVNFDDNRYFTANPIIQQGLTVAGVRWAFSHEFLNLWHPLSLVSFMIDSSLFGQNAFACHLENLLIHIANVLLVFALLLRATRDRWRSALVAALFAVHPLRVESVVWVSERKDVLAMLFGLVALLVYVRSIGRRGVWSQLVFAVCLALSLLSKPMFLPMPLLMLLLDYWPLRRLGDRAAPRRALLEKAPAAGIVVLFYVVLRWMAPHAARLHSDTVHQSLGARLANSLVSYARYLRHTVLPINLATPYPIPAHWPALDVVLAGGLLLLITLLALRWRKSRPWLPMGWAWFVIAIFPVIGVVAQTAFQAMTDRYTYLPSIGLFLMLAWSVPEPRLNDLFQARLRSVMAGAVVLTLLLLTRVQVGYWHDSIALFEHAVRVTDRNDFAFYSLGNAWFAEGQDIDRAIDNYNKALQLRPDLTSAHDNLGYLLSIKGQNSAAIEHYRAAIAIDPQCSEAFNNWGVALANRGDLAGATGKFRKAIEIDAGYREARINLSYSLLRQKQWNEAQKVLAPLTAPAEADADALFMLAQADAGAGRLPSAIGHYRQSIALRPGFPDAHLALAMALQQSGRLSDAAFEYRQTLRLRPNDPAALAALGHHPL